MVEFVHGKNRNAKYKLEFQPAFKDLCKHLTQKTPTTVLSVNSCYNKYIHSLATLIGTPV